MRGCLPRKAAHYPCTINNLSTKPLYFKGRCHLAEWAGSLRACQSCIVKWIGQKISQVILSVISNLK
jgi:hypothetical protein